MRIKLTSDDGIVLEEWEIERDFGDIRHKNPASTMACDIVSAFKRWKLAEDHKKWSTKRSKS